MGACGSKTKSNKNNYQAANGADDETAVHLSAFDTHLQSSTYDFQKYVHQKATRRGEEPHRMKQFGVPSQELQKRKEAIEQQRSLLRKYTQKEQSAAEQGAVEQPSITLGLYANEDLNYALLTLVRFLGITYKEKIYYKATDFTQDEAVTLSLRNTTLPYLLDGKLNVQGEDEVYNKLAQRADFQQLLCQQKDQKDQNKQMEFKNLIQLLNDLMTPIKQAFEQPSYIWKELIKECFEDKIAPSIIKVEEQLTGKYFMMGYLTLADFKLYQLIKIAQNYMPEAINDRQKLQEFMMNFEDIVININKKENQEDIIN